MNEFGYDDRILLVSPQSPFGETSGSRQRTLLYYDTLSHLAPTDVLVIEQGSVTDTPLAPQDASVYTVASTRSGTSLNHYAPDPALTRRAESLLPQPLSRYSLIAGRYLWSLCQLDLPRNIPTIVDLDDFSYRFDNGLLRQPQMLVEFAKRRLKEWAARQQLKRFDGLVFVTPRDQKSSENKYSTVCPNVFPSSALDLTSVQQAPCAARSLLFVGSMWYGPNRDGIEWFLNKVWPLVSRAVPGARFDIVGAAPPAQRLQWERMPSVSAPGFVENLNQAYSECTAVVIPVWYGGGSNIKLLEALAQGKPCVASKFTHQAFKHDLTNGKHLFVAENAHDFAAKCIDILLNKVDVDPVARFGRTAVTTRYSAAVFSSALTSLIHQVAPGAFSHQSTEALP